MRKFARERLAGYQCPRHYVFVDEIPLDAVAKVEKKLLPERYASPGSAPQEPVQ